MTNYIEEMMKTAGVEPKYYYDVTLQDTIKPKEKFPLKSCTKGEVISYCRDKECYGYCNVDNVLKVYPDFTAEKQIKVIKLIGLERGFKVIMNEGYDYILAEDMYADDKYNKQGYSMTNFAQALAQLTTELINAGELDKQKVKELIDRKEK